MVSLHSLQKAKPEDIAVYSTLQKSPLNAGLLEDISTEQGAANSMGGNEDREICRLLHRVPAILDQTYT